MVSCLGDYAALSMLPQYMCSPDSGVSVLVFGQSYTCQCEGETLMIDLTVSSTGERFQGSIICPSCAQICHDDLASCPASEPAACRSMVTNTGRITIESPNNIGTPSPDPDGSVAAAASLLLTLAVAWLALRCITVQ